MAGCCKVHKPCLLHVYGWHQTKRSKYRSNTFFLKMAPVILGSSCSFKCKFGFSLLFKIMKSGGNRHDWQLRPTRKRVSTGPCYHGSIPQSHHADSPVHALNGNVWIWDLLASFLDSGRKWRCIVHLYKQWFQTKIPRVYVLTRTLTCICCSSIQLSCKCWYKDDFRKLRLFKTRRRNIMSLRWTPEETELVDFPVPEQ